ncbi:HNH endonuclease signature motif containing protein [Janibacter corallicola]|uniref:HNH endonuclease signature motif containing protein n=1 Tax=Janibacter corallicola TaxID=415212 RepID=UPI00082E5458|nr:HNH endonuclease signature motif containing protein [Janibacter corallicola]
MATQPIEYRDTGVLPGLRDALRCMVFGGSGEDAWRLADDEVELGLSTIGALRQLADVAEVALVREGVQRGIPAEQSWSPQDWVNRCEGQDAPEPPRRHVSSALRVAKGESRVADVTEAFTGGDLSLGKADQLIRFESDVSRVADPDMLAGMLSTLLEGARDTVLPAGPDERASERVHGMSERELAVAISRTSRLLKPEKDLEKDEERARRGRTLYKSEGPAGMSRYRLLLDPEGAAVLDSALAALSEPVKGEDGEPDLRSAAQRRADALVDIVGRGVASPGEVTTSQKAQVHVTIPLWALLGGLEWLAGFGSGSDGFEELRRHHPALTGGVHGGGLRADGVHGAGVTMTGQVLAPSVVRRMACEAGILPVVLGEEGEILEMGRSVRFFTPGQRRAVWLRDAGCTYPGCTMPPQWCDAHHVDWWSRGGGTDIDNAALLCQQHHTKVHRLDATATVTGSGVTWHL